MNKDLAFDFSVDKENHSITVKREFAAALPLVWDAYTKSEILDQWWAPKPWKARTKTMDFTEGGKWVYAMVGPEGEEHWSLAEYQTIESHKEFTSRDAFGDADGNINEEMPQSTWVFTFSEAGENTLVESHLTYEELSELETILEMGFKEGYTLAMEGLDELLETLKK
jgi:uncharacterized protein YndB with AHSA1/START domain